MNIIYFVNNIFTLTHRYIIYYKDVRTVRSSLKINHDNVFEKVQHFILSISMTNNMMSRYNMSDCVCLPSVETDQVISCVNQ